MRTALRQGERDKKRRCGQRWHTGNVLGTPGERAKREVWGGRGGVTSTNREEAGPRHGFGAEPSIEARSKIGLKKEKG